MREAHREAGARQEPLYSDALPTPSGWFCLGEVEEFREGQVTSRQLAGREVVVFRTRAGDLAALDAHCPHLGAHLGLGGRVEGETLRCPFHGFCFDARGECVKTAYPEGRLPSVRARSYPVRVLDGVALVYLHPRALPPSWRPEGADAEGWPPYRFHRWTLRGHPQETTENSVDVGHFAVVHGYREFRERAPLELHGPRLRARYEFRRPTLRALGHEVSVREAIDLHVWGLGYSRVHVTDLSVGLDLRLLVLPTPLDAERIDLRIGLSVRDFGASPRLPASLRRLPRAVTHGLLGRALLRVYRGEVEQDFRIWAHKRYVDPPRVVAGDGPIGLYRRWARQFYDEPPALS